MVDILVVRCYYNSITEGAGMKYTEDYGRMTDEQLVQTYNAVMANAYPGDESAIETEMERRGIDPEYMDQPEQWG